MSSILTIMVPRVTVYRRLDPKRRVFRLIGRPELLTEGGARLFAREDAAKTGHPLKDYYMRMNQVRTPLFP